MSQVTIFQTNADLYDGAGKLAERGN